MKRLLMKGLCGFLALMFSVSSLYAQTYEELRARHPDAVLMEVVTETAKAHAQPRGAAAMTARFMHGEVVLVYETFFAWYAVAQPGQGHVGFIQRTRLKPYSDAQEQREAARGEPIKTAQVTHRSTTEGLRLDFHLNGTAIGADDTATETDQGGGVGIGIGYGFSRLFTLYLDVDGALMNADEFDEYSLAHADLGGRFHFGSPQRQTVPYLNVALTGWSLEYSSEVGTLDAIGGGGTVGGGLLIFVSRSVALDISLNVTYGSFTEVRLGNVSTDIKLDATSARFAIGLTYFRGRR